jgi:hypothetical protein
MVYRRSRLFNRCVHSLFRALGAKLMTRGFKTFATTRDVVIPAGTLIQAPPTKSSRWGHDWEGVVEIDRDRTGYFSLDLSDAINTGLVTEVSPSPSKRFS